MNYQKGIKNSPQWSSCVYICIKASQVCMFRFLLEAEDNLGIMTVVDRWGAVLKVRFSPDQKKEVIASLQGMKQCIEFSFLTIPSLAQ